MYDLEHPPGDIFVHFSDDAALSKVKLALSLKSLAALARMPYDLGTMDLLGRYKFRDNPTAVTRLHPLVYHHKIGAGPGLSRGCSLSISCQ